MVGRHRLVHRDTLALLFALAAIVGLTPGSASAENSVVNSSPSNGAVLNVSPDEIVIGFADELGEDNTISVDCEAEPVTLPPPEVLDDGTTLSVEVVDPLETNAEAASRIAGSQTAHHPHDGSFGVDPRLSTRQP